MKPSSLNSPHKKPNDCNKVHVLGTTENNSVIRLCSLRTNQTSNIDKPTRELFQAILVRCVLIHVLLIHLIS